MVAVSPENAISCEFEAASKSSVRAEAGNVGGGVEAGDELGDELGEGLGLVVEPGVAVLPEVDLGLGDGETPDVALGAGDETGADALGSTET